MGLEIAPIQDLLAISIRGIFRWMGLVIFVLVLAGWLWEKLKDRFS